MLLRAGFAISVKGQELALFAGLKRNCFLIICLGQRLGKDTDK